MDKYPNFLSPGWATLRPFDIMPPPVAQPEGAPVAHRSDLLFMPPELASFPIPSQVPAPYGASLDHLPNKLCAQLWSLECPSVVLAGWSSSSPGWNTNLLPSLKVKSKGQLFQER